MTRRTRRTGPAAPPAAGPVGPLRLVDQNDREWLTTRQVLDRIATARPRPIKKTTLDSYVRDGHIPTPALVDGQRLWPADLVDTWLTGRRGQSWRAGQTGPVKPARTTRNRPRSAGRTSPEGEPS